jgi:hypothetical protein
LGTEYLDLAPGIQNASADYRRFYFYCDPHWNISGHELVAEILTEQYLRTSQ